MFVKTSDRWEKYATQVKNNGISHCLKPTSLFYNYYSSIYFNMYVHVSAAALAKISSMVRLLHWISTLQI